MNEVHEVLCRARNLIDKMGWCQGTLVTANGSKCANGAINCGYGGSAARFVGLNNPVQAALAAAIPLSGYALSVVRISRWNDAPGRTKEEVLAAFDRAIAATAPMPEDPLPDSVSTSETDEPRAPFPVREDAGVVV